MYSNGLPCASYITLYSPGPCFPSLPTPTPTTVPTPPLFSPLYLQGTRQQRERDGGGDAWKGIQSRVRLQHATRTKSPRPRLDAADPHVAAARPRRPTTRSSPGPTRALPRTHTCQATREKRGGGRVMSGRARRQTAPSQGLKRVRPNPPRFVKDARVRGQLTGLQCLRAAQVSVRAAGDAGEGGEADVGLRGAHTGRGHVLSRQVRHEGTGEPWGQRRKGLVSARRSVPFRASTRNTSEKSDGAHAGQYLRGHADGAHAEVGR